MAPEVATSKTARWLDLVAFLLHHRFPVARETIFEHVSDYRQDLERGADPETVRRKFERDKDELRDLGIKIDTVELRQTASDEPSNGYRLRPGDFYLPYLQVARQEAVAERAYPGLRTVVLSEEDLSILDRATRRLAERMDFPLADAATSARRKLAFDLPLSLDRVERVLAAQLAPEAADTLSVLQRAVAQGIAVKCRLDLSSLGVGRELVLHPYGLFFNWGRWYCMVGGDIYRGWGWGVFQVNQFRHAELLDGARRFKPPLKFSVRSFLGRPPWHASEGRGRQLRVRFAFPESQWVLAQGLGKPSVPVTEDGGAEIEFEVVDEDAFLRWLLTFRAHAAILEPKGVKSRLARLRKRVAALYR